jgi:hypothetical protein
MRPELTVTALVPATATLLRNGEHPRDPNQRIMELEYENRHLKQAMSELMMEKLLLKVALEARYQNAPEDTGLVPSYVAGRNASLSAQNASIYVAPGVLGTHLRATYGEIMGAPLPDSIAEFIKKLEKGQRPSSPRRSLIGHIVSALAPMRFGRSVR